LAFFLALNIKGRDFSFLVFFMNHGGWGVGRSKDGLGRNTHKGVSSWRDKVYIRLLDLNFIQACSNGIFVYILYCRELEYAGWNVHQRTFIGF
jgi:hypothetical protein